MIVGICGGLVNRCRPVRPDPSPADPSTAAGDGLEARVRLILLAILQAVMAVELIWLLTENLWGSAVWLLAIMVLTSAPALFRDRLPVHIPLEYEVLTILFVFAALFLGEFRSFYERVWWWDTALHTTSGLLLGVLGFLLVYILNENRNTSMQIRPGLVALFAFAFAVAAGTLWEIFEFGMDQLFGTTMQKPTRNDPSGLTDTMLDLIVDCLGALVVCAAGWWHLHRRSHSFLEAWIKRFIQRNARFFRERSGRSEV